MLGDISKKEWLLIQAFHDEWCSIRNDEYDHNWKDCKLTKAVNILFDDRINTNPFL